MFHLGDFSFFFLVLGFELLGDFVYDVLQLVGVRLVKLGKDVGLFLDDLNHDSDEFVDGNIPFGLLIE